MIRSNCQDLRAYTGWQSTKDETTNEEDALWMAFTWLATSACEKSLARKARPSTLLKFSGEHQKFSELILILFAVDNLADTSLGVVMFLIYLVFLS